MTDVYYNTPQPLRVKGKYFDSKYHNIWQGLSVIMGNALCIFLFEIINGSRNLDEHMLII